MKLQGSVIGFITIVTGLVFLAAAGHTQVPRKVNYQGYLTDAGGAPVSVPKQMTFRMYYGDTGGTALWEETHASVDVYNGVYSVVLGSVTPIDLDFNVPYFLGVEVDTDGEMEPRQALTSVPYALNAYTADFARDIANDAITTAKIADNAVTSAKIADGTGSNLDADTLDGLNSHEFVSAADHAALQARVAVLEDLLQHFVRTGNEVKIVGANLHVVNGTGSTDGAPNSLGNVIIGYNELRGAGGDDRTGSHNLVVGKQHKYSSFGGIVAGLRNEISGDYASVSGGAVNIARGTASSVSGGSNNIASGDWASVAGGGGANAADGNEAFGHYSAILGGLNNIAGDKLLTDHSIGQLSTVSGGFNNTASGDVATVSGGSNNTASGDVAAVSGGNSNIASGSSSTVSGGAVRKADGVDDWRAGTLFEDN